MDDETLSKEEAASVYDMLAPVYGVWNRLFESRAADRAFGMTDARGDVLEVGVGTGVFFKRLAEAENSGTVVGVDLSRRMAERTAARVTGSDGASVVRADGFALPFDDGSFDAVFCQYVLDLLPPDGFGDFLGELRRVLRPDGELSTVTVSPSEAPANRLLSWLHGISPKLVGGCRPVPVEGILGDNGFEVREKERVRQSGMASEVAVSTSRR